MVVSRLEVRVFAQQPIHIVVIDKAYLRFTDCNTLNGRGVVLIRLLVRFP